MPRNQSDRKYIRLRDFDYTANAGYFVTLNVQSREPCLGVVKNGVMRLSELGQIAAETWRWLDQHYDYVRVHPLIVMPDHTHAIVWIHHEGFTARPGDVVSGCFAKHPDENDPHAKIKPLGQLIGAFKTRSTKNINLAQNTVGQRFWQRDFYEHIIRERTDYHRIAAYIHRNPESWKEE